jgi:DNA-binding beta-propeller fold protein YncE
MALSSKRRKSNPSQPPVKPLPSPASSQSEWVRPSVIGVIILLLVFLVLNAMNQGGISCFFPKHYSLKLAGHIRGEELPCGGFKVGGISYVKGGKIAVSDTDHHRLLLFDLKGQFLQALTPQAPGTFTGPGAVSGDDKGNVWVLDSGICGFAPDGTFLRVDNSQTGSLNSAQGLACLGSDFMVANTLGHSMDYVGSDGKILKTWGGQGRGRNQLNSPMCVSVDPQTGLCYTADGENSRIVVTDTAGKVVRLIYVKDKPRAVALDGKGTLFVGFGNHYFLQAYSLSGWCKGDGKVQNPDPDDSYLDVISLSGTDQGFLLTADPTSVWIYQLSQ